MNAIVSDFSIDRTLFGLRNLASSQVERVAPWEFRNGATPLDGTKEEFRRWCLDRSTSSCFFSGFEGVNAGLRVSNSNPPQFIHALVADYDAPVSPSEREAFLARAAADYPPNFISTTFSRGVRLVWLFESPLPVFSKAVTKGFLERLRKELRLKRLFPGLDEDALLSPNQYYHAGHGWDIISARPLSAALLQSWLIGVSDQVDWRTQGEEIPISLIAEEVEARFPGVWTGPFELGARGVRFWDPTADCTTAAIVRETGMQCFTGPKPFVTWREIFGQRFVDQFKADTIGAAIEGLWFDGRDYWREVGGVWRSFRKADVALHLRVDHGISDERRRGSNASDLDRTFNQIHAVKTVDGAAPFVFNPARIVHANGRQYLNIARSRLIQPADGPRSWGQDFPYIAEFLAGFFDPEDQLDFLLSWLAYGYQQAYRGKPRNGQVSFFAGDVNQGKTLFSNCLCGGLFGGHMDASDYLLGESRFNKELFEVGLWTVDDTLPSSDPRKQQLYSAMLKKIPANYSFQYHPKFRDQLLLPWAGRVIVTCNADPESIRILPDTEMSLLDKINLFKIRTARRDFRNAAERIQAELPFFARYLLDYQIPEHCQGEPRFGVKSYHHPELIETAQQSSKTAAFIELLEMFKKSIFSDASRTEWSGSASQLLAEMMADETTKNIAAKYSPDQIGRRMAQLMAQGYPVEYARLPGGNRTRRWTLRREDVDAENIPF
jgi:hypothetical protein